MRSVPCVTTRFALAAAVICSGVSYVKLAIASPASMRAREHTGVTTVKRTIASMLVMSLITEVYIRDS